MSFSVKAHRGELRKLYFILIIRPGLNNLGFGDWNEGLQDVDDANRSNNGDRDQVLATVAYTAVIFTNKFPETQLIIKGSTVARTRLYQMGIAHNLMEINEKFEIMGLISKTWEVFQHGRNYHAFLIIKK